MIRKKKGSVEWLEFPLLADEPITHGIFLRQGGVSQDSFASLNVKLDAGDNEENVKKNRTSIREILKIEELIDSFPVHGTKIKKVNYPEEKIICDGLMTNHKNWGLLTTHADCQAAIFYDPKHKAIANVHAGWRGQVKNIYREAITKMAHTFSTKPQELLVCISPSLGPQYSEFKNYKDEIPEELWQFQFKPTYFDLWEMARYQLESNGILPHHIEIAKIDTYSQPLDFFSYRREKATGRTEKITGCHATVVALLG